MAELLLTPALLAEMVGLIDADTISGKIAKQILPDLFAVSASVALQVLRFALDTGVVVSDPIDPGALLNLHGIMSPAPHAAKGRSASCRCKTGLGLVSKASSISYLETKTLNAGRWQGWREGAGGGQGTGADIRPRGAAGHHRRCAGCQPKAAGAVSRREDEAPGLLCGVRVSLNDCS